MLEIIIVNIPYLDKSSHIVSSINLSPSLFSNSFNGDDPEEKIFPREKKDNPEGFSHSISAILEDCKFSLDPKKHKNEKNLLLINLISPRIGLC